MSARYAYRSGGNWDHNPIRCEGCFFDVARMRRVAATILAVAIAW
jgi:hypothetical protein